MLEQLTAAGAPSTANAPSLIHDTFPPQRRIIQSLELPTPKPTLLLPNATFKAGNTAEPFICKVSEIPKIPSFRVIYKNGGQ